MSGPLEIALMATVSTRDLSRRLDRIEEDACPKCGTERLVIRVVATDGPPAKPPPPCRACGREPDVIRVITGVTSGPDGGDQP